MRRDVQYTYSDLCYNKCKGLEVSKVRRIMLTNEVMITCQYMYFVFYKTNISVNVFAFGKYSFSEKYA